VESAYGHRFHLKSAARICQIQNLAGRRNLSTSSGHVVAVVGPPCPPLLADQRLVIIVVTGKPYRRST
jgi:hypothetical protein